MNEPIVRIAARGDGVTASGRHIAFGVPGDILLDDGALAPGPHHQDPPCRHFPDCGGCQLQHADDQAYRAYLVSRIEGALAQHNLTTSIRAPHLSPPQSRRRTSLRALKTGRAVVIGFNAAKSNRIVDMRECHILRPELFALIDPLRKSLHAVLPERRPIDVHLTLVDQGVDLLLKGLGNLAFDSERRLIDFAIEHRLARLSIDGGLGPETLFEPMPATVRLSRTPVRFPPGSFLQATVDGEAALAAGVKEALGDAKQVGDLFSGLGTFALAAGAVYAAEASRDAAQALAQGTRSMRVDHRDLYRRPLDAAELAAFDGIIVDPPRAGAEMQVERLVRSDVGRIAYVSCNPATFARDARVLTNDRFLLEWVRPVGQFRWSTHVELVACFVKKAVTIPR